MSFRDTADYCSAADPGGHPKAADRKCAQFATSDEKVLNATLATTGINSYGYHQSKIGKNGACIDRSKHGVQSTVFWMLMQSSIDPGYFG
jgi:hypothetical protein